MVVITDLPNEILLHIFRFYLETESQQNLMENIANVSLDWKNICLNSYLWTKFDGTISFEIMMNLSKTGCLINTKQLILSSVDNLNNVDETALFSGVKNVEVIHFSKVKHLSKNTLTVVADNCTKLKDIQIGMQSKMNSIMLNYNMLSPFFAARGYGIVKINLSYCRIINFSLIMRCISDCCPNLEHLELMNIICPSAVFPTKYFQMHCPKLKVLNLDQNVKVSCLSHSSGFPELELFTYLDRDGYWITDKEFEKLLFNSSKLKFLNLTNCHITAECLCALPTSSLECLYISRSKACLSNDLSDVLKKWCHSLKEVDLSHSHSMAINKGIFYLVTIPTQSVLEYLDISFTKIIGAVVEEILLNCTHLATLNLQGCRNLGRGMKKTYEGSKEFSKLSAKLHAFKSSNSEVIDIS